MNLTRKKSSGTYKMESSGPKVPSRYLRGPTGSCHDQCKCVITTQPTEPKTINSFPKRIPKPPRIIDADNSVNRIKKAPSVVPKSPTRMTNVKNNKFVKNEGIKRDVFKISTKKDVAIEQKSRDSKPKTQISRTSRRRHSDVFQPIELDTVLPLRVPRRRVSDIGSVSNASMVRGSSISKNESRKDSKLPSMMNKKSNNSSLKTIVSSPKPVAKVLPPLRSYRSLPRPELKGSRKLKPTKTIGVEAVPEKMTLHAIGRTKSQIPISSTSSSPSSSEEKVITCNGLQESCSPSMEDNTPATDGQNDEKIADSEDKNAKENGKLVVETIENQIPISSSPSSSEEKVITCNGLQESCSPLMEDNTPATDGQHDDKIAESEDKNAKETGKLVVETIENQIPISPSSTSEEKVVTCNGLQECPPSMEDNIPAEDGPDNDKISDSEDKNSKEVGKLVVELETTESQILPISSEEKVMTPPLMEDDTPATDVQNDDTIEDSEERTTEELNRVGKLVEETTERQIHPISSEEKVTTPLMEDGTSATDGQKDDDTIEDSEAKELNRVGKLTVETEDGSLEELKFRRGKVVSPQSENSSPRKLQFRQGKELEENESEKGEKVILRRVSSDGAVVISPEISQSINVDLKHQEVVEKKDLPGPLNNVIEETARKLIQTRKSKVKALVGAFENVTW